MTNWLILLADAGPPPPSSIVDHDVTAMIIGGIVAVSILIYAYMANRPKRITNFAIIRIETGTHPVSSSNKEPIKKNG